MRIAKNVLPVALASIVLLGVGVAQAEDHAGTAKVKTFQIPAAAHPNVPVESQSETKQLPAPAHPGVATEVQPDLNSQQIPASALSDESVPPLETPSK